MVGVVPDSHGTLAVYVSEDESGEDGFLALSALQQTGEIARLLGGIYSFGGGPRWAPDGEEFYVSAPVTEGTITGYDSNTPVNTDSGLPSLGGNEVFSVTRDGVISRLTFLTTAFVAGEDGISVSPDGSQMRGWGLTLGGLENLAFP